MAAPDIRKSLESAVAHHRAGRLDQAERIYREVLAARPDTPDALHLMGVIAHQTGNHDRAVELIGRALRRAPRQAIFHNNLGEAQRALGRLPEAVASYRRAIGLDPDGADAHTNLGHARRAQGMAEESVSCYRRALALDPRQADAEDGLGNALAALGRTEESIACFRRAVEINRNLAETHNNLGLALVAREQLDDAIRHFRRAVAINRDFAEAHANLGAVLLRTGALDDALAAYRRAIEARPDFCLAYRQMGAVKSYENPADPDIAAMERLLGRPSLPDDDAMHLAFALGKAHDDLGRYDTAFGHFRRGNEIKRRAVSYDGREARDHYRAIIAASAALKAEGEQAGGCPSSLPILIVGMPRAGTTLVEQILASHPQVHGAGELHELSRTAFRSCRELGGGAPFPDCLAAVPEDGWRRLGEAYVAALESRGPGARRITDKMPGNHRFLGLFHMMLPNAAIVHVRRDPVATCFSIYRTLFAEAHPYAYDLAEVGAFYRLYDEMMAYWRAALPGRIYELRYEDLVRDQVGETRRLLAHCGLDWDDACLAFHRTARPVATSSASAVRRPLDDRAVAHWRHYDRHLGPLHEALSSPPPAGAAAEDEVRLVRAASTDADGRPRFEIEVPRAYMADVGIRHLVARETEAGGYEYPTRAFFDAHLRPGDVFADVGAHWGVFAFSAATRAPGMIDVLAIEAHPDNVTRLAHGVALNGLDGAIEVIAAAAGAAPGTAPLVANSTMGNSLYGVGLHGIAQGPQRISVPVVTLDDLVAERPALAGRRLFLKIDVEGWEPQVVMGARGLIRGGRVAALVWEKGRAFEREPARTAMLEMIEFLEAEGFTLYRLPNHDLGGALLPFVPAGPGCNVFALGRGFAPEPAYVRPAGPIPAVSPAHVADDDPAARAALTELLIPVRGSEGARWGDPAAVRGPAAEARARLAAPHLRAGDRVLDLGAGALALRRALPEGADYTPVDLVPFAADAVVLDLNRGDFPPGQWDVAAALELLEYIHDLDGLLRRAGSAAPRLLCTYRFRQGEPVAERRRQGWFNDLTEAEFRDLLAAAGWAVEATHAGAGTTLFVCGRG